MGYEPCPLSDEAYRAQHEIYKRMQKGEPFLGASIRHELSQHQSELKKPWWKRMIAGTR
jgi:hypothetical protein